MSTIVDNFDEYLEELDDTELQQVVSELPVHDLVELWDSLEDEAAMRIFLLLDIDTKVALITSLSLEDQEWLIKSLSLDNLRRIFEHVKPDDLVDIMQAVNPEVRESVWNTLSQEAKEETRLLLRYEEDEAAGLMTPRFIAVRSNVTVGKALHFIRSTGRDTETVYIVYVVDRLKRLEGVVSLKDLLFTDDTELVADVMERDVITVRNDEDQEEAARILSANDLIALPVVDDYNRLLGIITFDDVIDVIMREQTEDVYKMGAMSGSTDRYTSQSVWRLIGKRIPWLIILLVAGTITTNVINLYDPVIAVAGFLVWFVPVITQTGGNTSLQSSTLVIRGIATGEVRLRDIWLIVGKELVVGMIMGLVLGGVLILRGSLLPPAIAPFEAMAIGSSLVFVILFSNIVGAIAPLLLHAMKLDPTVMAGPLMATVVDVVGLSIYFNVARILLGI